MTCNAEEIGVILGAVGVLAGAIFLGLMKSRCKRMGLYRKQGDVVEFCFMHREIYHGHDEKLREQADSPDDTPAGLDGSEGEGDH